MKHFTYRNRLFIKPVNLKLLIEEDPVAPCTFSKLY